MDASLLFLMSCLLIIIGTTICGLPNCSEDASEIGFNLSVIGAVFLATQISSQEWAVLAKISGWAVLLLGLGMIGLLLSDLIALFHHRASKRTQPTFTDGEVI